MRGVLAVVLMVAAATASAGEAEVERARAWLVTQQRPDGAIADAANPLFETWETVLAARALASSRAPRDVMATRAALDYLASQRNVNGLLCHNRRCRGATCVETSAEYLQLLIDSGQIQSARTAWPVLLGQQMPDGHFQVGNPDVRERRDFASVTAFVLAVGARLHQRGPDVLRASSWLDRARTPQGDFGRAWEYYGTPAYALWPAARAWAVDPTWARSSAPRLFDWARATQGDDGLWSFQRATDGAHRVSAELETALMLLALRHAGAPDSLTAGARRALIERQQADGRWEGGLFPIPSERYVKREDVFATAITVLALQAEPPPR